MKYSQFDEELYIAEATADIQDGKFLDIGAWAPKDFSNSRALYERGWGGIVIEPSPEPCANLIKEYGRDLKMKVICAAVGIEPGLVKFHATADAVSTSSDEQAATWEKVGGFYGSFLACQITLEDIFNRFGGNWDFVNIDTEGSSADLCLKMLAMGPRPKCICVEHDNRMTELCTMASNAGYKMAYANSTNAVFVRIK